MSRMRILSIVLLVFFGASCSTPFDQASTTKQTDSRAVTTFFSNSTIQVRFQVDSSWSTGYSMSIYLQNVGSTAINSWDLEWSNSSGNSISNAWNLNLTSLSSSYKATPVSYNQSIPPGATVNLGFNGNGNSANAYPLWVKFNSVLLGGSVTPSPAPTASPSPSVTPLSSPSPSPAPSPSVLPPGNRPVDKYGQLKVVGNRIQSQNSVPVQLRGLSSHGLQWFPFVHHQTVKNLVATFKPDVIRAAMYVKEWDQAQNQYAGYLGAQPNVKQTVIDVIEDAIDEGVYVIVDWHIHWNPPTYANPYWTASPYTTEAVQFFAEMANTQYQGKAFKNYPNVIWEVMNEPGDAISWGTVKSHANAVIQQIRVNSGDSDNLILVPATCWAQALDQVAYDSSGDRPDRMYSNIVYTLHFYAASHGADVRSRAQAALDNGLAVFADEWGTGDYTGNGSPNYSASLTWVNWMNSNMVSWTMWNVSDKSESSALLAPGVGMSGPWTSNQLSTSGNWAKDWISQGR